MARCGREAVGRLCGKRSRAFGSGFFRYRLPASGAAGDRCCRIDKSQVKHPSLGLTLFSGVPGGTLTKYKPYSRREFQRHLRVWLRDNLRMVTIVTGALVVVLALETFLLVVVATPVALTWWLLGAVQAGIVAVYLHLLHAAFLANDREAIWHLRGSWGDDNTRSELQRAKRRRLIWGWVDSITLQSGDIDHLVVTGRGGLVVNDSKWRNRADDQIDMAKAAHKAKLRAEAVAKSLVRPERARHRSRSNPLSVTPVVVLWSAARDALPSGARTDGIEFIPGRNLVRWLSRLDVEVVTKAAADDLIARLEGFRADAWESARG